MRTTAKFVFTCMVVCISPLATPAAAWADDRVTYEVVSTDIGRANIEYQDRTGRVAAEGVTLPWRTETTVRSALSAPPSGSEIRADWRPAARPSKWVTVRIYYQGKVVCQSTLDVGDASCYGVAPHMS